MKTYVTLAVEKGTGRKVFIEMEYLQRKILFQTYTEMVITHIEELLKKNPFMMNGLIQQTEQLKNLEKSKEREATNNERNYINEL